MKSFLLCTLLLISLLACQNSSDLKDSNTSIVRTETGFLIDSLLSPYVEQLRQHTDNQAGLAIGITKGDQIIYARTFGFANIEKNIPADLNTIFHIASVSKPFTAAAVVKLVEQEKLKLEDRIIDFIPEFEMQGSGWDSITVKHVLTHTSGIPRHLSSGDWENPDNGPKALEKNLEHAKEFELDFTPGTDFNYSNSAFDILGIVIARASGMTYHEYIQNEIFKSAGMDHSHYQKPIDSLPDDWAVPYSYGLETQEWSPYPYTGKYFPSSGLQTTVLDMCRWGLIHLNQGKHNGSSVFDESSIQLLTTPFQETPWGDQIGLSWFLQSYLDRPIIMHTGNDTGFESVMYIYPEEDISIIVMANRDFSRTARIVNAASEMLFNQKAKDYSVSAKYQFSKAYQIGGIEEAKKIWPSLKTDTTDIFNASDGDLLTTGAVLENGKYWQESKEVLEYYLSLNNQSTYAWRLIGNAHLNLGDTAQAISAYQKTLEINPNYEKGRKALEDLKLNNQ